MLGPKKIMMAFLLLWMIPGLVTCVLSDPEENWALAGTWINETYEGDLFGKVVFRDDGTVEGYKLISDINVDATGTYVIEDDWTEKGIHWFKVKTVFGATPSYELDKLTNDGNTYESVYDSGAYPASLDPTSPAYRIRFRQ